ncbi:permease prefix domain 1-containing protein [Dethiothermospora halolimnae]|uniref:permease prefix domain 1-containing protein n=1 Tax=Dethiothermospora halolimnae TaxID=3114390 RepID=UPI003CCB9247
MEYKKIDDYLGRVSNYIKDQEVVNNTKEELKDHILAISEDYIDMGYSENEAVDKSIDQMGNAKVVGRELNSIHSDHKNYFMITIYAITIIATIISVFYSLNGEISILELISILLITLSISIMAIPIIKNHIKFKGKNNIIYHIRKVKAVSSYQSLARWIFGFYIILLLFILISEIISKEFEFNVMIPLWQFISIYATTEYTYTRSTPIYEDGIFAFNRFIKWEDVKSYRWIKSHRKNGIVYEIRLELNNIMNGPMFKVDKGQMKDIENILSKKGINNR